MAPKKRSLPQQRVRPAKRPRRQKPEDDDDADFVPDNSAGSFVANSTDAQPASQQTDETDMNQGSIYEAVSRRRSDQLTKSLLPDHQSTHSDSDEVDVPSDDEYDEPVDFKHDEFKAQLEKSKLEYQSSLRPAALGPPTLTDTWVPPMHYQLPRTIDYAKPRAAIIAEHAAATGARAGPASEEAAARQHVRHLFSVGCPLPSLHGAAIPTEAWLARPHETLTKGLQEAAAAAADRPALSDAELFSDFAAMGMFDRGDAAGPAPGAAEHAGDAPAAGLGGGASAAAGGEEEGEGGGTFL